MLNVRRAIEAIQQTVERRPRLNLAFVLVTLVGGLILTAIGTIETQHHDRTHAHAEFQRMTDRLGDEVQRRMHQSLFGLKGLRGMYAASSSVSRREFHAYVESRDVEDFPGVLGFGFIERVRREDLDAFVSRERADGAPEFTVRTSGEAPELYVIKFVEPLSKNRQSLGFDVGAEPVRRAAVERAIRTGQPALTDRITLVQDDRGRAGFLYLVPVFRTGVVSDTPESRDAALVGFVYAPIVIDDVFAGLMAGYDGMLDVEVFEAGKRTRANLLLDADGVLVSAEDGHLGEQFGNRMFKRVTDVRVGGREWILVMTPTAKFEESVSSEVPLFIAIGGSLVTALLSGIVLVLGHSRARAIRLAEKMTSELRASETEARRLAMVASRTSNAVIITDSAARIQWVNDGFTRITGYTLAEVQGRKPGEFLQGAGTDAVTVRRMRAGIQSGTGFEVEVFNYGKGGRTYWLAVEVQPLRDEAGRVTGFMAVESDITARKIAEQKLVANEQRLTALTAQAPGVIFQFEVSAGGQRRFAFLSAGFRNLFGRDPADALHDSASLYEAVHEADRSALNAGLNKAIADCAPWTQSFRIVREDGGVRWLQVRSSAIRQSDGSCTWFGMLTDVTEQQLARVAAEELNARLAEAIKTAQDAAKKAEQANVAKSQFLATMSHEIRTPMNGVIGMTSILLDTPLNAQQQEFIEIVRSSGETLLSLINDILDFSKIESGRMDLESEPFSVGECVESALDLFAARASEKGIDLLYQVHDDVPREVRGDITRIRQILVNLVGNALKFTEKGEVEVTVRSRSMDAIKVQLQVDVRDTGIGIPKEAQGRLFQSFSQVDASTTRRYGGTGLGLAISKRLAEIMHGEMWVESEQGRGTTFSFTLTLDRVPQSPKHVSPAVPAFAGKRLLVVDNNGAGRRMLSALAEKWGMPAVVEEDGAAALTRLRGGGGFDLAVVDMQMPEMDGVMLAREIRAMPGGEALPLILLSSIGRQLEAADDRLFAAILSKPVKPSQLFDAIAKTFGGRGIPLAKAVSGAAGIPVEGGTLRILLAEDNPVNRKVALHILARGGFRADTAANGVEVLAAIRRQPYDVILMDMQMPEMDGLEATRRIRALNPGHPWPRIIALTANAMERDRELCVQAGMDDYLSKPIRTEELIEVLTRAKEALSPQGTGRKQPDSPTRDRQKTVNKD